METRETKGREKCRDVQLRGKAGKWREVLHNVCGRKTGGSLGVRTLPWLAVGRRSRERVKISVSCR
jgi:hypothetical protein